MTGENRKIKLPSGAELEISPAPFADAKALYQAFLSEGKGLELDGSKEIDHNFMKDIFCAALSSPLIEEKLWECMKRCRYNKEKLVEDIFEPVESRDDYFTVMFEVAKENILPFTKSLYAQYKHIFEMLTKSTPE